MGRADEAAIRSGTPAEVLMDRAGRAVARAVMRLMGGRYGRRVVVVCGKGNNAGDGYVAARALAAEGVSVRCVAVVDPGDLGGAARHHFDLYRALGGAISRDLRDIAPADVVVDAIFGTGYRASGPPPSAVIDAIDAMSSARGAVVSVDIPSGVDGATGAVSDTAVRADVTVALAAEKIGTALSPGARHAGRVRVAGIGIPIEGFGHAFVLDPPREVPRRNPAAHKRSAGSVAVLAGSDAMQGAAVLTVRGAQRVGSGYVTLGTTASVKVLAHRSCPEALVTKVTDDSTIGAEALESFADVIERADCVALGPGIGTGDRQRALVDSALATIDKPVVLDADALNVLAADPSALSARRARGGAEVVLTPHPAELGRLLGTSTDEIQRDRAGAALEASERFGAVVVLKGWRSVIAAASDGGRIDVCPTGGPELATAGTGDVLTGAVAGLGGDHGAACAAVYVHGLAGTIAGELSGPSGVVAWDVAEALPEAWSRISAGESHDWLG